MENFLKFIGTVVVVVISTLLGAYALSTLWGWFIVSKFGLPSLGYAEAIGVNMVVAYMTHQIPLKGEQRATSELLLIGIMKPLIALGVGWVVLQFI